MTTPDNRAIAEHVLSCLDTIYFVLGERAGLLRDDAFVVRTYEMSRAFGEAALEVRAYLGASDVGHYPILQAVLEHSIDQDDTGAMLLYAMAMVVGPRLLVTALDARAAVSDDPALVRVLEDCSTSVVREIRAIGDVVAGRAPMDDLSWQHAARDLTEMLDSAGNAESLGISR